MRGFGNIVLGRYIPTRVEFPIFGSAADIKSGAVVMSALTEAAKLGMVIKGVPVYDDVVGVLESLHDYSVVGDSAILTGKMVWGKVDINPFSTFLAEYDQTSTVLITGATSATKTIELSATFDQTLCATGWWYVVSGAGKGQLRYVKGYNSGDPQVATDFTTDLVTGDKSLFIAPLLRGGGSLLDLNSDATKILSCETGTTDGSVPSGKIAVIQNYIKFDGKNFEKLDVNKHDGLDGLDTKGIRFFSEIFFLDHQFNPA